MLWLTDSGITLSKRRRTWGGSPGGVSSDLGTVYRSFPVSGTLGRVEEFNPPSSAAAICLTIFESVLTR